MVATPKRTRGLEAEAARRVTEIDALRAENRAIHAAMKEENKILATERDKETARRVELERTLHSLVDEVNWGHVSTHGALGAAMRLLGLARPDLMPWSDHAPRNPPPHGVRMMEDPTMPDGVVQVRANHRTLDQANAVAYRFDQPDLTFEESNERAEASRCGSEWAQRAILGHERRLRAIELKLGLRER